MEYEFICSKCRNLFSIEKIVIGKKGRAMFDLVCPKKHTDKQYLNAYLMNDWVPSVARQLYLCPKCGLKLTDISRATDDKKTTLMLNCPTHFKIKKVVSNDFWFKMVSYKKHIADKKKLAQQPIPTPARSQAPSETTPSTLPVTPPGDSTRVVTIDPETGFYDTQATVPEPAPPSPQPQAPTPPPSKAKIKKPPPAPEPSPASQPTPFSSERIETMDKALEPAAATNLAETLKAAGIQSKDLQKDFKDLFGGTPPSPSPPTIPSEPTPKPIEQDLMQPRPSQVTPPSLIEPPKPPIPEPIKEYEVQPSKTPLDLSSFSCPICEESIYSITCPFCNETTYDVYQCQNCNGTIESITCESCGSQIQLIDL